MHTALSLKFRTASCLGGSGRALRPRQPTGPRAWWVQLSVWLLAAFVGAASAGTNTWTTLGPEGGTIKQLFFNQTNPSIVYATSLDRFYRSVDGGNHWQQDTSPGLSFVRNLAVDPKDSDRVYLVSSDLPGIYASIDAGATFTRRPMPADLITGEKLLVAADGKTLYLLGGPRIFISQDLGATWEERTPVPAADFFVTAAQVDLKDPNLVYVSLFTQGTFITRDGGRTWQRLVPPDVPPAFSDTSTFAVNPLDPQRLYLGGSGLFVTEDQGRTFTRLRLDFTSAIGLDFQNPDVLYASSFGEVQRSTDRGATWTNVTGNLDSLRVEAITLDPGPSSRAVVTTERGVFSAATGGDNWLASNAGITAHSVGSFSLSDSEVFAPSSAAVSILNGSDVLRPINVAGLFAATRFSSTGFSLVSLGSFPDTKVLGVVAGRIALSEDSGQRWSAVPGAPVDITFLAASRGRPGNVLATDSSARLFRSTTGGSTFEDVSARIPANRTITRIAFARAQPAVAYAAFEAKPNERGEVLSFGLYKTVDAGATFVELPMPQAAFSPQILALAIDPSDAQVLYAGTSSVVLKTADGGMTWEPMTLPTLLGVQKVNALHVDPVRPRILYALTPGTALRSVNGGRRWQILTPVRAVGSVNQDIVTDPARAGVVRVATSVHSIQQMTISPDVGIAATDMPATLPINAPIEVTYTLSNLGPFDASDVGAVLRLPASAQDIHAHISHGTCTVNVTRIICTTDALLTEQPETITLRFTSATGGAITVNADVTASEPDTNSANNSVIRTSNVAELADLSVRLEGTQSVTSGGEIAYRLSAMNSGPSPATAVRIAFQLAPGLSLDSIRNASTNLTCTAGTAGAVSCETAILASGQAASVALNVTRTETPGIFQSTAQVSGTGQDPAGNNNTAMIVTTVTAVAPPQTSTPPTTAKRNGGGGSMAPLLLVALAALAVSRLMAARPPCSGLS